MSLDQISFNNSTIRLALKNRDSKLIYEATLRLFEGNRDKADQLSAWFSEVAESCKSNAKMNMDISMMRMWQLGNMDIKDISAEGKPFFVLTSTGSEKIRNTPKDKWFEVLFWNRQKLHA